MSFVRMPFRFLLSILLGGLLSSSVQAAPVAEQSLTEKSSNLVAVDVNVASVKELTSIPSIGVVTAKRIVEYRKVVGPFRKIDELLNVKGIGARTLERIRPLVRLSDAAAGSKGEE